MEDIPYQHSLIVTNDSQIMICGGLNLSNGQISDSCFVFNPEQLCLDRKAAMEVKRVGHAIC